MNNRLLKLLSLLLLLAITVTAIVSCGDGGKVECTDHKDSNRDGVCDTEGCGAEVEVPEFVDYVSNLKLDMTSETKKLEVTVKLMIDGDTTHFNAPKDTFTDGTLKARYLAVNTPESTGKIEEWGKQASNFTKEKLSNAVSIIVESDDENWNVDSTGGRHLVWVWYRAAGDTEYRNLNLELLQNGFGRASNTSGNRYGSVCMAALNQAKDFALKMHSTEKDPLFYYGDVLEINLRELRLNIAEYEGTQVAFDGIVSTNSGEGGVYVEAYDSETDMYYGVYVYYENGGLHGDAISMLKPGNEVRIVGTVSEFNGTYQVSGLKYKARDKDDPGNMHLVSTGNPAVYRLTDPVKYTTEKIHVDIIEDGEEKTLTLDYAEAALGTSVSFENLYVKSGYTTKTAASMGEMSLYCTADGVEIVLRTAAFSDGAGGLLDHTAFVGKTIDVKGIVDFYSDNYQIKVFDKDNITIK